jgi:hypothetical protein
MMIEQLKEQLQRAIEERDRLNATIYANSDWSSAPEGKVKRLKIAIKAVEAGATQIDTDHVHGVLINNWLLVALNTNRWSYLGKTWYFYKSLDELFKKHITEKK